MERAAEIHPLRSEHPDLAARERKRSALSPWAHALVLLGAAAAVFLSSIPQGSLAIFLVCAGVAMIISRPAVRIGAWFWALGIALSACSSLALLPARWLPMPKWWHALKGMPIIPLPDSITPVPWQTAFWLALLAASVLLGLFLLTQPLRSRSLLALALVATLTCGTYAALSIYARVTGWHYPFSNGASFGFFPNRNHAATFLVTGSLLAIGVLGVALRFGHWFSGACAAACLTICVVGLFFFSSSRGGIIFLLVGAIIWVAGLGRAHRNRPLLISCFSLLLAGLLFFLVSGGEARSRLLAWFKSAPVLAAVPPPKVGLNEGADAAVRQLTLDERLLIYKDTLPLLADFPLTGTGLGTFGMVFPQYRRASLSEAPAIHPESDWLMLAAEAGVPALICAGALLGLAVARLPRLQKHPYWPLRWGCVVAAGAGVVHGLVDVPVHHVSLGWWLLALAGLGLQPGRQATVSPRARWQHVCFALGGAAVFLLGVQMMRAQWFGASPLPPFANDRRQKDMARAIERQDYAGATRLDRAAIAASPLGEIYYYQLGALELPFTDSDDEVSAAFAAERLLEPNATVVPYRQGQAWMHYNIPRAAYLWNAALIRHEKIDHATGAGPAEDVAYLRSLMLEANKQPDMQQGLLEVAKRRSDYTLAWLEGVRLDLADEAFESFANQPEFLNDLGVKARKAFLEAWYARGDRDQLTVFIDTHAGWQDIAWPIRVELWADANDFHRAVETAVAHLGVSLELPEVDHAGQPSTGPQPDGFDPVAAFQTRWRNADKKSAVQVLDAAISDRAHNPPAEIRRLKAAVAARDLDWPTAWQNVQAYLKSRSDENSADK